MTQIKTVLQDMNPWWKEPFQVAFKERTIYRQIHRYITLPQILAITGLRRVGKTTLLLKIAEDEIKKGVSPLQVLYFSFDEFQDVELRDVLQTYEDVTEKNIRKEPVLLLFDEIQKLKNWENQLKGIYDTFKKSKIIISGSESLFIRKKSKETLAGRLFEFQVEPLSFQEFLQFKGSEFQPIGLYEKELSALLDEFTLTMGFPELIGIRDKDVIVKYVTESIVEKIVYRDLPTLLPIKDVSVLRSLLTMISEQPGQILSLQDLAQEFGVSRQTIAAYLAYLEDSFLVKKLYNFSKNRRKAERSLKKYYPTIISPNLLFADDVLSRSRVFEWLMVMQLHASYFWRDPAQHEVDVVLNGKKPVPVEIKYRTVDTVGVEAFMKKFLCATGYIVVHDFRNQKIPGTKRIAVVTAFRFLLREPRGAEA